MFSKVIGVFSTLFFLAFNGYSQNCTLNIGGENSETIVKIFQLNPDQISKMETFRTALKNEVQVIDGDIQKLFETHPQSTPEELLQLAEKYKALQEKVWQATLEGDKKLLSTFNPKQYQRYLSLCSEALRDPIVITPVPVDTVVDPK